MMGWDFENSSIFMTKKSFYFVTNEKKCKERVIFASETIV